MALPAQIAVSFDFSSGATFGYPFVIGDTKYGILGVSQLGASDVPVPIVDLTPDVRQITINRGRSLQQDTYEAGTCVVRVIDTTGAWNPQNTSSPYYPYLVPLRKLRVSATTGTDQQIDEVIPVCAFPEVDGDQERVYEDGHEDPEEESGEAGVELVCLDVREGIPQAGPDPENAFGCEAHVHRLHLP